MASGCFGPAPGRVPPATRARALLGAATLHRERSEFAAAIPLARQSVAIRREIGDEAGIAEALGMLAEMMGQNSGDSAEWIALATESLAIRQRRGDVVGAAWSPVVLGTVAMYAADYPKARVYFEEARALRRGQEDNLLDSFVLRNLGLLNKMSGDLTTARRMLERGLAVLRRRDEPSRATAWILLSLGDLLVGHGDAAAGHALLEEGLTLCNELGEAIGIATGSSVLGKPVADGMVAELGEPVLRIAWRSTFGREMPSLADLQRGSIRESSRPSVAALSQVVQEALTARELEVLLLLGRRASNREIAEGLVLSVRTVERHVANIYAKLGVSGRRQAALYARQCSLLPAG